MPSLMLGTLELLGAPFSAQVGTSMGAWESITSSTSSLFLDGSVVSGEATANREIPLKVMVDSASRPELIAACESLIGEANKASNTLMFVPDEGPPIVYEVFRVRAPERVDDEAEAFTRRVYSLSFPALPFARSATRESPAAIAPAISIEDFEAAFTGAELLDAPSSGGLNWWLCPVGSAAATPIVLLAATTQMAGSLTAVTNCTVAYPSVAVRLTTKTVADITATAAGLVEVRTTASWPVSGDVVTVAMNIDSPVGVVKSGVEWLDGGGATLRTDWGAPYIGPGGNPTIWAASRVPAGAVSVRIRLVIPAATAGLVTRVLELGIWPSVFASVAVSAPSAHDGAKGYLSVPLYKSDNSSPQWVTSTYLYRALSAAVDLTAGQSLMMWLKPAAFLTYQFDATSVAHVSVRLWDSAGLWSRFWFTPGACVDTVWTRLVAPLSSPYESSDAGAVNLTDVVAYDIDTRTLGDPSYTASLRLDTLTAGPTPTATTSIHGTVYNLDPIIGSARTVAAVEVSSVTALTDWLVAAIDGTTGPPLLSVTANVATVTAPAGYDGVYSILGCVAPSIVLATPTCTVVQKNAGTTVATRVLTGTQRVGNRYVDFGAVELPLVATPPENLGVSYTFTLAPSSASWVEVLVIDVDASLAWVDNMTTALPVGWIDEPDIIAGLGKVWVGTATDRTDARALALPLTMSKPLQVKAPSTRLLVYSTTTAPDVALSYFPRWLVEPT